MHVDVVGAYHPELRREILDAASGGEAIRDGGVYACFEGVLFRDAREIRLARLAGADGPG